MKLKFIINNLLAAALITGAFFSVSSCKDNDADLFNDFRTENSALNQKIDQLSQRITQCQTNCHTELTNQINGILALLDQKYVTNTQLANELQKYVLLSYLQANYYDKAGVEALIPVIPAIPDVSGFLTQAQIEALIKSALQAVGINDGDTVQSIVNSILDGQTSCSCDDVMSYIKSDQFKKDLEERGFVTDTNFDDKVNAALSGYVTMTYLTSQGYLTAADLEGYLTAADLEGYLTAADLEGYAKGNLDEYLKKIDFPDTLKANLADALDDYLKDAAFKNLIDAMTTLSEVKSDVDIIKADYAKGTDLDALSQKVTGIDNRLKDVESLVNALLYRINNLISGVTVESVSNVLYGQFALPFDIKSNILIGYYGKPESLGDFPDVDGENAYNGNDAIKITPEDQAMFALCGWDSYSYNARTVFASEDLGKLYVTVNPINVNHVGTSFDLVKSNGDKAPLTVESLTASNEILYFGYSRANNGFYEAKVKVAKSSDKANPYKNYEAIQVNIDDALKTAVKDCISKNRTKSDFISLGKAIYEQFNNFLPAYALRAEFKDGQDDDKNATTKAFISSYDIAATAFKPLSYSFLYGKGTDRQIELPDWERLNLEGDNPMLSWHFKPINVDTDDYKFDIDFGTVNVTYKNADGTDRKLWVHVTGLPRVGADGKITTDGVGDFPITNLNEFLNEFNQQLTNYMKTQSGIATDNLNDVMTDILTEVEKQVNKNMQDLENEVNDLISDINNKIYGNKTLKNMYDKLATAVDKVNKFLKTPNNYLQPLMFYSLDADGKTYGRMSTAKASPTQLVLKGGNAITLIPSNWTAEIAVPSWKKFVAVSDVYTSNASAQGGNAACQKALKTANANMCKVMEGDTRTIAMELTKVPGAAYTTYEIIYQSLDYHGTTSTIKCYVTVK